MPLTDVHAGAVGVGLFIGNHFIGLVAVAALDVPRRFENCGCGGAGVDAGLGMGRLVDYLRGM